MKRTHTMTILLVALILVGAVPRVQAASWLANRLSSQYQIHKKGQPDGTVLVVQQTGIFGSRDASLVSGLAAVIPLTTVENGMVKSPGGLYQKLVTGGGYWFSVGDQVYVSKLIVHPNSDTIMMNIVCTDESCQGVLRFKFPRGFLRTADAAQVVEMMNEVVAIQGNTQEPEPVGQPGQPLTIELGQTTQQVQATLGSPDKIANVGEKAIYIYRDFKITFTNGNVSDVQ